MKYLMTLYRFKGGFGKEEEVVFLRREVNTPMHTMMTKKFCQFSLKCRQKYCVQRFVDKILQKHLLCISSKLLLYLYF